MFPVTAERCGHCGSHRSRICSVVKLQLGLVDKRNPRIRHRENSLLAAPLGKVRPTSTDLSASDLTWRNLA
jgi:hypothetical protein